MKYVYLYLLIGICVELLIEVNDIFGYRKKEKMLKEQTLMINPNYYTFTVLLIDFIAKSLVHILAVLFWFVRVYRVVQYFNQLRKEDSWP